MKQGSTGSIISNLDSHLFSLVVFNFVPRIPSSCDTRWLYEYNDQRWPRGEARRVGHEASETDTWLARLVHYSGTVGSPRDSRASPPPNSWPSLYCATSWVAWYIANMRSRTSSRVALHTGPESHALETTVGYIKCVHNGPRSVFPRLDRLKLLKLASGDQLVSKWSPRRSPGLPALIKQLYSMAALTRDEQRWPRGEARMHRGTRMHETVHEGTCNGWVICIGTTRHRIWWSAIRFLYPATLESRPWITHPRNIETWRFFGFEFSQEQASNSCYYIDRIPTFIFVENACAPRVSATHSVLMSDSLAARG